MGSAEVQGELWGRDPQTWADLQEPQMRPIYGATLDALEPLAGPALLDAGCGSDLVVALATGRGAAASGPGASAPLLQVARARTPGADLRTRNIEALPYRDASFDIVTAFNAIQYAADPAAAVQQLARVADPEARSPSGSGVTPAGARPRHCSPGCARSPRPRRVSPRRWRSATPGAVEKLLDKAGLILAGGGEVPVSFSNASHAQAWTAHTSAGPLQKVIDITGPDAVRQAMHDVLEADRKPDGQLRQGNIFRHVLTTKP